MQIVLPVRNVRYPIIALVTCLTTVSYTHLDVYKRQALACGPGMGVSHEALVLLENACQLELPLVLDADAPVSYTHLDVYKRQIEGSAIVSSASGKASSLSLIHI